MGRWRTAIAVTALLAATASLSSAQQPAHPFTIRAVGADAALSAQQAIALRSEVDAIWAPLDVRLVWQPGGRDHQEPDWTIAIDLRDEMPFEHPQAPRLLGAVRVIDGRLQRTIYVSLDTIRHFLAAAGVKRADAFYDLTLGRFVGRVVAHELGHLLLASPRHRDRGLMRERFAVRDTRPGRGKDYTLDGDDLAALRARLFGDARRLENSDLGPSSQVTPAMPFPSR